MAEEYRNILDRLPYQSSFRFVDEILFIDANRVVGRHTLRKDAFFYEDHFPGYPVTPGVIIIEIMSQIGLVTLGIYQLLQTEDVRNTDGKIIPLFTSADVEFFKLVLPGETVEVRSEKKFFRLEKLKCFVEVFNSNGELVARGNLSGVIRKKTSEHLT